MTDSPISELAAYADCLEGEIDADEANARASLEALGLGEEFAMHGLGGGHLVDALGEALIQARDEVSMLNAKLAHLQHKAIRLTTAQRERANKAETGLRVMAGAVWRARKKATREQHPHRVLWDEICRLREALAEKE